jgi:hypothetical protein
MDKELQDTIRDHQHRWRSNPAMKALIDDYVREHIVVAALGGFFVLGFALLSVFLWERYRRTPRSSAFNGSVERRMYLRALLLSSVVGSCLGLIVFVNAATALDPVPGFFMANTPTSPNSQAVDDAVNDWIESGNSVMPVIVEKTVSDRVGWQRPKAIVSGILFIVFAALSVKNWQALIRRSNAGKPPWSAGGVGLLAGKVTLLPLALLTMVMFIANTASATAPLAISLLGGS